MGTCSNIPQESGIGSLAPERTCGLPSRGEPRPQVRQNTVDGRAWPARAGEAHPPEGALLRGTGGREPPLRGGEAGIEPRSVPKTQRELEAPSGGGSEPPYYWRVTGARGTLPRERRKDTERQETPQRDITHGGK
ncbi:hypothetical protein NDU88_006707 [Pleurodeles waltl]|uniref:Uncharacterized protein n=1 Tax=Pleurodeles waltl TaxID=8319 RepID=A0AAV7RRZ4_PLEWA|nr:hypothetical protein NDU88_006707 [Pleurodeles waltl]